ncbi:MAG: hypothetical protein ACOCSE_02970, partial [Chitinivibrionales bacterium]
GQELNVSKGTGTQSTSSGRYLTKKEVLETGSDIRYIDTEINLKTKSRKPYTSPMLILLLPIPFIIFLFSLLYRFQSRHKERNAGRIIKNKSTRNAVKELTRIDKGKYRKDWISDVSNTLIRFLSESFSVNAFSMTTEELQSLINKKTGDQELSKKYCELLKRLDSERFGGGPGINKREFVRSSIETIKTINRKGHKE